MRETINLLTYEAYNVLAITTLKPTSNMLELVDQSVVKHKGTLEDIIISTDSWEYPIDFLVIN